MPQDTTRRLVQPRVPVAAADGISDRTYHTELGVYLYVYAFSLSLLEKELRAKLFAAFYLCAWRQEKRIGSIFSTCGCKRDALNYVERSARGGDGESDYHRALWSFAKCLFGGFELGSGFLWNNGADIYLSISAVLELKRAKSRCISSCPTIIFNFQQNAALTFSFSFSIFEVKLLTGGELHFVWTFLQPVDFWDGKNSTL